MILKPNKYLKAIGIDENYWLFNKEHMDDPRYQPDEDGFVDAEFFSLDTSISLYIYSQLCYFREYCLKYSIPMGLTEKQWKDTVDAMIKAFELMIVEEDTPIGYESPKAYRIRSKNRQKKINRGFRLFMDFYHSLWY